MATEDQVRELRARLLASPTDLATAQQYWDALGDLNGHDIRSGRYVVEAFGQAALNGDGGVIALGNAYQELFHLSGEGPRKKYLDDELLSAIRRTKLGAKGSDLELLEWLLDCAERFA
jgi:hypothetical protein